MRYVAVAILGFLSVTSLNAVAESHGGLRAQADTTPTGGSSERRSGELKMPKARLEVIAKAFATPLRVVEKSYDAPLFEALRKLPEEKDVAKIIARWYVTIETKELPELIKTIEGEKKTESEKPNKDEKWLSLLDRVLWAAPIATKDGIAKDSKPEFNEAFKEEYKLADARRNKFNEDLEKAPTNAVAAAAAAAAINPDFALAFGAKRAKAGDEAALGKLMTVMAKTGGAGQKYLEMIGGPNAEAQRLYIGTNPAEFANSLKVASAKLDNFENVSWYPKQHETPAKTWFVQGDEFKVGVPAGGAPPVEARPATPPPASGGAGSPASPTTPPGGAPPASGGFAAVKAAIESPACTSCHGSGMATPLTLEGSGAGAKLKGKSLTAALEAGSKNPAMPPAVQAKIKDLISKL